MIFNRIKSIGLGWWILGIICLSCSNIDSDQTNRKPHSSDMKEEAKNVLGTPLQMCCLDPLTGFYRDGSCHTGPDDYGTHVVCAVMTDEFLQFTKARGNDLCTTIPERRFPGLKDGDQWCLCALRWKEAMEEGVAPPLILESTHAKTLEFISFEDIKRHQFKAE